MRLAQRTDAVLPKPHRGRRLYDFAPWLAAHYTVIFCLSRRQIPSLGAVAGTPIDVALKLMPPSCGDSRLVRAGAESINSAAMRGQGVRRRLLTAR